MPPALPGTGGQGQEEERRVRGAISSFFCGLHKAVRKAEGHDEIRVQESQR